MAAALTELATAKFTIDAQQAVAELERLSARVGTVEAAIGQSSRSTERAAVSADSYRDKLRPMGEQLSKIRTAFSLAGVAANEATGATAAWLTTGLRIAAVGGGWAAAIAGIGVAVGKLADKMREAEQLARAKGASAALLGVSETDLDFIKSKIGEVSDQMALKLAQIAKQSNLSREQLDKMLALARTEVDAGLVGSLDQSLTAHSEHVRQAADIWDTYSRRVAAVQDAEDALTIAREKHRRALERFTPDGPVGIGRDIATTEAQVLALEERLQAMTALLEETGAGIQKTEQEKSEQKRERQKEERKRDREQERREREAFERDLARTGLTGDAFIDFSDVRANEEAREKKLKDLSDQLELEERLAALHDDLPEQVAEMAKAYDATGRAGKSAFDKLEKEALQYSNLAESAAKQVAMAAIAGGAAQAQAAAQSIASQAALEAAFYAAKALAFTFIPGFQGQAAGMWAAAAAMAGVAAAAGAVAGGIALSGGGGGGGGGGGRGRSSSDGTDREPGFRPGTPTQETPPGLTVVFSGQPFATEADIGKAIRRALNEYDRGMRN